MRHPQFMGRALQLVRRARHRTSPNPKVGCVVVKDGVIVGEGVTRPAGGAHAEILALEAAGDRAKGADMYVTLEPCCHHGRTPPCTEAIKAAGIARVFAGVPDPNPVVNGAGLAWLHNKGIETSLGPLEGECDKLIAPFSRFIRQGRPWVILKAAMSLDGRIATAGGDSKWITGEAARRDVHRMRARADAVLVGSGTALADNPRLTVRSTRGKDPLRVILDSDLRVPIRSDAMRAGTLVFHAAGLDSSAVAATGAEPIEVPRSEAGLDWQAVLDALAGRGVVRLLVEGGGRVHGSLMAARLADEACFYIAPCFIGEGRPVIGMPSLTSVAEGPRLEDAELRRFGPDVRIQGAIRYPAARASGGV